ncbi:hypothetical protein E4U39_000297, partial [Claviceps sp. Clav50 group G5]
MPYLQPPQHLFHTIYLYILLTSSKETSINNDKADFCAHQAALNLTQTNHPKNTSRNYDPIAKEWRE